MTQLLNPSDPLFFAKLDALLGTNMEAWLGPHSQERVKHLYASGVPLTGASTKRKATSLERTGGWKVIVDHDSGYYEAILFLPAMPTPPARLKKYTFTTYSPLLKQTFTQVERFESESDFRLYATALYSGNWSLVSVE